MSKPKPDVPWWACPDPWALDPEQQQAADERHARHEAEREATPDQPPF